MTALLATVALAQQQSNLVADGKACGQAFAIAGTSSYLNMHEALRTNAATYAASKFAEDNVFSRAAAAKAPGFGSAFAYELHTSYNVEQVPAYHPNAGVGDDCDAKYQVAYRPLDLSAVDFGYGFRYGPVGAYFAGSVTNGQIAQEDNFMRGLYWSGLYPIYGPMALVFAPVTGTISRTDGGSAVALDFVAAAIVDAKYAVFRAGYTQSRGVYANARDRLLGTFASLVVRPGEADPTLRYGFFRGGIERASPARLAQNEALEPIGMTTAFYRDLPYASEDAEATRRTEGRLRSGHFRQDSIGGLVDLDAAYRLAPEPSVSEVLVAGHTPGWHLPTGSDLEDSDEDEDGSVGFLAQAGAVELPTVYTLGTEGGWYFSARLEGGLLAAHGHATFALLYNDSEQLALYPFARNALSYTLSLAGQF